MLHSLATNKFLTDMFFSFFAGRKELDVFSLNERTDYYRNKSEQEIEKLPMNSIPRTSIECKPEEQKNLDHPKTKRSVNKKNVTGVA